MEMNKLSIASAGCGVLSFILVFFPDLKVITLILGIAAVALGIWTNISDRSWLSIIGIIFGGFPILFFIQMELITIYIKEYSKDILESIF